MRNQLVATLESLLPADERLFLLLGDIGVYGFRDSLERFPSRVFNIGILEQATIGLGAGLALTGFTPVIHTIAPFLVERCLEQLKIDFCFQKLGGNFISVGASYDYAALGATHHCPADVPLLLNLPGMEIAVPGTAREFDRLFRQACFNGRPTYFRLSERENPIGFEVDFGRAQVIQTGGRAAILAMGPALTWVMPAVRDLDVTVLYYTCAHPFDADTLVRHCPHGRLLLCEPYYAGALVPEIVKALSPAPVRIECLGVPRRFIDRYGHAREQDVELGLTPDSVREKLAELMED